MDTEELKADVAIDPAALDVEWVKQTDLLLKWSERSEKAKDRVTRYKEALEVLEARLQKECRSDPQKFGLIGKTDAAVRSAVRCSDEYAEGVMRYHAALSKAGWLDKVAVTAINEKKRALEHLVKLHAQHWFAGPNVPRNLADAWAQTSARGRAAREADVTKRQRASARTRRAK